MSLPRLKIEWGEVPNKAMLSPYGDKVYMDYSLAEKPLMVQKYAYYHEIGHIFNNNPPNRRIFEYELNCDKLAADELVSEGASRTEIIGSMELALAPLGDEDKLRIKLIEKYLSWLPY